MNKCRVRKHVCDKVCIVDCVKNMHFYVQLNNCMVSKHVSDKGLPCGLSKSHIQVNICRVCEHVCDKVCNMDCIKIMQFYVQLNNCRVCKYVACLWHDLQHRFAYEFCGMYSMSTAQHHDKKAVPYRVRGSIMLSLFDVGALF